MYYQYYDPPPSPEPLNQASSPTTKTASKWDAWVTAQLHLYGIPFQAKASAVQLKSALEAAVKNRQVRKADQTTTTWEWTDRPSA
ncbi:hypothetical protein GB937_003862 [Aspergillus fischeri]|nr:hypothetical protein GB937_003862 [Aspergillus fischeri]